MGVESWISIISTPSRALPLQGGGYEILMNHLDLELFHHRVTESGRKPIQAS
ncbi:hypothetical protein SAMN05660284_01301 [Formivibrio citricus]|uniref:Uncharacterized protein n=1 Tax=Formivibrio citricus TaxID=83765 RepID=A0A1I4YBU6_9NEIS|nr:hypothetical protein SAMN05660284_01301 [Formivibrio citricus]